VASVQMSNEAWLTRRNMDASKKIFVPTGILAFDFELFIAERCVRLLSVSSPWARKRYTRTANCATIESVACKSAVCEDIR